MTASVGASAENKASNTLGGRAGITSIEPVREENKLT